MQYQLELYTTSFINSVVGFVITMKGPPPLMPILMPVIDEGRNRSWHLWPGRYRVNGLTIEQMAKNLELLTPVLSTTSTVNPYVFVKTEPEMETIILLSDDDEPLFLYGPIRIHAITNSASNQH